MKRHENAHLGVRPYRCPYCAFASVEKTNVPLHIRTKHRDLPVTVLTVNSPGIPNSAFVGGGSTGNVSSSSNSSGGSNNNSDPLQLNIH